MKGTIFLAIHVSMSKPLTLYSLHVNRFPQSLSALSVCVTPVTDVCVTDWGLPLDMSTNSEEWAGLNTLNETSPLFLANAFGHTCS